MNPKALDLINDIKAALLEENISANVRLTLTVDIGSVPSKKESDHVGPVRIRTDEESILRGRVLAILTDHFDGEIVIESKAIIVKKTE